MSFESLLKNVLDSLCQLAGISEGREWMLGSAKKSQRPLVASSTIVRVHDDETIVERKERLVARYTRDTRLLQRIQPYERSRSYYTAQGLDLEMMAAQAGAEVREGTEDRNKKWWDILSLETTKASIDPHAAGNNRGAAAAREEEVAEAAAARVGKCSEAYRAYWRGLTVKQKAAEKEAAGAYIREFLSAIVEGIRGEPPEQVVCGNVLAARAATSISSSTSAGGDRTVQASLAQMVGREPCMGATNR